MLIGVIADDFTGASDIANTLAKGTAPEGGLVTAQFAGVPEGAAPVGIEAGVISLKSRTAPVAEAVADSLAALEWLLAQGCQQILFKYCSTFDSTPQGNIGPVAEALAARMGASGVVVCPAFPGAGRTVYQGHLFVFDRLLSDSGMQHHPLTPMTDPDIRRVLAAQTTASVGHVAAPVVRAGSTAVAQALEMARARGEIFCVTDAVSDDDLLTIGTALADARLITGGSGIALGLPRNLIRAGHAAGGRMAGSAVAGPAAILAGSCSGATLGQVARHAAANPTLAIDVAQVMAGQVTADTLMAFYASHAGAAPLAFSSGTPDEVRATQDRFGRAEVAHRLDTLFAETARLLLRAGFRRFVVAGGETSGAVAQAVAAELAQPALRIGPEIDPGVPILSLDGPAPVALALKSGNFGAPDFFAKALEKMETA
ncbi:3-oxo-tetronate kinase [Frigidibacter sp. MR17.14]|uniref:3-oxo-tetronate kinase n=1 Tax=Frigidibacter sp. MR17.14 TaxID=3126509 RepID=UPI003012DD4B